MIRSIRHKGLRRFFESGISAGIQAAHIERIRARLSVLEAAMALPDINRRGWGLHPLSGTLKGYHAISVSGNWRLQFRFEDGDVHDLDYLDYH